MPEKTIHRPPLPKMLLAALFLVLVFLFLLGSQVIKKQKQALLRNRQIELSAIADLKTDQVVRWKEDRVNEGEIMQENRAFIDLVYNYTHNHSLDYERTAIISWMNSYISHYDYRSIILLDDDWVPVLSLPETESFEKATARYGKDRILKEHKVILSDLHKVNHLDYPHFDMMVPLYRDSVFAGLLLFRIDPSRILYPLLKKWPSPSVTGETYITRKANDSIVYISELKFLPDAILKERKMIAEYDLPSSLDPKDHNGIVQIKDYRNRDALVAIRPVPGTSWDLVAKIDTEEILENSGKELLLTRIIIILILVSVLSLGGLLIWYNLVRYYKKMYQSEMERQALIKHFNYILKYANDLIFLIDDRGIIVEVNDRVIETYGYSVKELKGHNASIIRAGNAESEIEKQYQKLRELGSLTFEAEHRKKNGERFPVEISGRVMEIEGNTYFQIIGRDITERKKQEQSLNSLVQKYNLALSAADLGVWEWDFINNKLTWDDTVSNVYGKDKNSITDSVNEWINVVHPDDVEKARAEVRAAAGGGTDYNSEYRIITPDGRIKYIRSIGRMLRDLHGNPMKMTGVTHDITEQRKAIDLLKERDFWLSESQRAGRVGSFSLDLLTNKWSTSEVLDDILGLGNDDVKTTKTWQSLVHPDHVEELKSYFNELLNSAKKTFDREYKIIRQNDKEIRWILGRGEISWTKDNRISGLIGTIQDITERKKVEEELRQSNRKINTIINNLKGVVFSCLNDRNWTMKYISDGIHELAGYEPEDLIDNKMRSYNSLIYASDRFKIWNDIQEMLKNDSAYTIEYRITTASGATKWVWERGRASYDGAEIKYVEGFITDITDRKHVEEELIRARDKAEESDRLKTAFLHNVSHEIRTPMNAIVGFTTLLDSPDLDIPTRKQYMDIIFQSSNQLLSIITDIVDISNIEVGHVKLSIGTVNINTLVKNLYDQFSLRAKQQGIQLFYTNSLTDDASFVLTDGTKLIQVLTNLVNNALKFTTKGSIELGYTLRDNDIEFFVKDTGIGIDEENYEKIFNRFYQIESAMTKQYAGTGLGLAISKAYVELMGGRIWLASKPGRGTTFYFTIPYDNPEKPDLAKTNIIKESRMTKANGRTILVAEDDRINFLLVREILSKTGIIILWAANGEEAVELCRKNKGIDLILMDIKMPIMDGYEAMKNIREFRPEIPVIAITAYAQESDREKALAEGCVAHITKPIDRTQLFGVLQKYL